MESSCLLARTRANVFLFVCIAAVDLGLLARARARTLLRPRACGYLGSNGAPLAFAFVPSASMTSENLCRGFVEANGAITHCVFSMTNACKPAQAEFDGTCLWCSKTQLSFALQDGRRCRTVAKRLAIFKLCNATKALEDAVARLRALGEDTKIIKLSEEILGDPNRRARLPSNLLIPDWIAAPSTLVPEKREIDSYEPAPGAAILVLKKKNWDLALAGIKTIEVRQHSLRPSLWYVGHSGEIWGTMSFGKAVLVADQKKWLELMPYHHVEKASLPYIRTYAHPILSIEAFKRPVHYEVRRGQIHNAVFRRVCSEEASGDSRADGELEKKEASKKLSGTGDAIKLARQGSGDVGDHRKRARKARVSR